MSIDQPLRDELRKSEERFAIAFHANPLATVITSLADGRFVDFNNNYCHLTGYRREELLGNPASAVPIWDSATERRTLIENLLLRHSVHEMEARYRTAGGECRDALVSAEVIEINGEQCILSVVQDITRRKQTEHLHAVQLAVSRLLSQALAYDVSVINDIMQNLYGMCSCTSVETWTAETQGLVLVAVWPHVSPEQPSRPHVVATAFHTAEPAIQQSQGNADNHPRFDFAFPIQHRGSVLGVIHLLNLERLFHQPAYTIFSEVGHTIGSFIHRVRVQDAIKASEERYRHLTETLEVHVAERTNQLTIVNAQLSTYAEQAQRMLAWIDTLTHDIAHYQADMAAVIENMFLDLAPNEHTSTVTNIRLDLHALMTQQNDLLSEMLDASRLHNDVLNMVLGPIDLADVVTRIVCYMQPRFDRQQCQIDVTIHGPIPLVLADAPRIERVFRNILINALTYAVKASGPAAKVRVTLDAIDGVVRCSVHDNGSGIAEAVRDQIGTRFVTTNGTGIGLSLCFHIIQAHPGGLFSLEPSSDGVGTVALFALPLLQV